MCVYWASVGCGPAALVGGAIAGLMALPVTNILVKVVVAFVGAVILLIIFRAVAGRSRMHA